MGLTILEILYIVLIFFTTIVWTLLRVVLYKLIRILNTLEEIFAVYDNIKSILVLYKKIPDMIFSYVKDLLLWKKK